VSRNKTGRRSKFMASKDSLTNESLKGFFKNNFELANFAIQLGRYYIKACHEISLGNLLEQVRKNPSEKFLRDLEMLENEEEENTK
jgi:hypothetical protein